MTQRSNMIKSPIIIMIFTLLLTSCNKSQENYKTKNDPTPHVPPIQKTIIKKSTAVKSKTPNLLFILVDDLGWRDLGHYGSDFYQTPHIDNLAKKGMSFSQAYTAAHICSPTRMSILTGKHPAKLHVTDWIPGWNYPDEKMAVPEWNQKGLSSKEITVGEILQQQGYTTAWLGKWHVRGFAEEKVNKEKVMKNNAAQLHGFDKGHQDFSLNKFANNEDPKGVNNLTEQAISFISNAERKNKPWFVTISHYSVHTPVHFNDVIRAKYEQNKAQNQQQKNSSYAAMVESLDESVGKITQYLIENKLDKNTMIVFYSDNGGLDKNDSNTPTNNAPLRNGKASLYEGGIRVPLIVSWPKKIKMNTWNDQLVSSIDILPTFSAISGAIKLPEKIDGIDLSPVLFQQEELTRTKLYWHYPHYHRQGRPSGSIRDGKYKLIQFFDNKNIELYDLSKDIGETNNLAMIKPKKVQRMLKDLEQWRTDSGAQMMKPNLNYNPDKAEY